MSGVFVAVVGPSGAGKDTLLQFARERLEGDARYVFVRRVVTRPADRASEDHDSLDLKQFEAAERAGAYALSWDAHGLRYGLPAHIDDDIAAGRVVIANVSRRVLGDIAQRYSRTMVVAVSASPEIIAERLAQRGREDAAAIGERLSRTVDAPITADNSVRIDNSGPLVLAGERLVDVLVEAGQRQVWPQRA